MSLCSISRRDIARRWSLMFITLALFGTLPGCGESAEDKMMRAAMRVRPQADGDEPDPPASRPAPKPAAEPAPEKKVAAAAQAPSKPAPAAQESANPPAGDATPDDAPSIGMQPIEQRKPEAPLDDQQRRAMAIKNLEAITEALMAYKDDNGRLPTAAMVHEGFPTLSWRVSLLPYLGYQYLYDQFDPTLPWNRGKNKELLKYIPDVYVSPERFDTKTNWLLPAHEAFIFGENRAPRDVRIEDGLGDTLMLVEVQDGLAVEWTQPKDFDPPDRRDFKDLLGAQRGDGILGAWANGYTTFLSSGVGASQLAAAMSYESGEPFRAAQIHRDPDVGPVAGNAMTSTVSTTTAAATSPSTPRTTTATVSQGSRPRGRAVERLNEMKPSREEINRAGKRLQDIYADRIREAEQLTQKRKILSEMLIQAERLEADPAGAYALRSAAMKLAVDTGDIRSLLRAVDSRVQRFSVDPYEVNATALAAFAERNMRNDNARRAASEFAKRAVVTIRDGILQDDYDGCGKLASMAAAMQKTASGNRYQLNLRNRNEVDPQKLWTRLSSLLSSTKQRYADAAEQLARFRQDDSDGDAASSVGRFLCFIKGDWQTGLPLLTQGGIEALQTAAQRDLQGAANVGEQVALGDMWWELGQRAKAGVYKQGALDRAGFWYESVYEVMPESLDKLHVKARLDELNEGVPGSPLAALRQLSLHLQIPPDATLEQLATGNGRAFGNDDDDDD
ncbi:DUF1559 domain-containing protein [Crateriforma conspicua]|uniref:DUF1559 domain-containing protein n=1 Tax=Crateriforma conspicua TaxID=2527996 RepID=A0A5C6FHC6_9PLAN|nr:DUF1559 domain-containing protein [Crateriforma conspicua]TWU60946.1 hypothetical protein V7x_52570 [Crateriforma conspicua]